MPLKTNDITYVMSLLKNMWVFISHIILDTTQNGALSKNHCDLCSKQLKWHLTPSSGLPR